MTEFRREPTTDEGYRLIRALVEIRTKADSTEGMTGVDAGRALESIRQSVDAAIIGIPHEVVSTALGRSPTDL